MSLSDVKSKLYKKEADPDLAKHEESRYDPKIGQEKLGTGTPGDVWGKPKIGIEPEQKKAIKKGAIAAAIVVTIIFVLTAGYLVKRAMFFPARVIVTVSGPVQAESGKPLSYEIKYKNNNWIELNNAILRVTYPENFHPDENVNFKAESLTSGVFTVGKISRGAEGRVILTGRMYSPKGALIYVGADIIYSPSKLSTQYSTHNQLGVNVVSSPIYVEVIAPLTVAGGDEVGYLVTYKNTGQQDFGGIRIKMDYPEGFTFSKSEPAALEGNNIWYVGNLAAGQEGKLTVSGKLDGNRDDIKNVRVYVGTWEDNEFISYSEETATTKVTASPVYITQTVNDLTSLNINAGQSLRFKINYRNDSTIGLKNLVVKERIDSQILDYTTLETNGGSFDEESKTITWKASDHPELKNLEPGQGGEINFAVAVKSVIPVASSNDKNFIVSSIVKIDSPDIPTPEGANKIIAGNRMDMKLNSKLVLDVKGYYADTSIPNFGPLPPKINAETTYTIRWKVLNISNDVNGAKVEAVLPTGVNMTGKIYPDDSKITYNERNNSVLWDIGNISAGSGITSSPKETSFQVKIKPSPDQFGSEPDLLQKPTLSAKDQFTGEDLVSQGEKKTTELREDESVAGKYKVVN